jgi:hypothetical protein
MKSAAKVRNPPLMSDVAHDPLLPFDDCLNAAAQLLIAALCLWLSQGCKVLCLPGPWFSTGSGIILPPDGVRD